jgi:hypothetical protein
MTIGSQIYPMTLQKYQIKEKNESIRVMRMHLDERFISILRNKVKIPTK